MLSILAEGHLVGDPVQRVSATGKAYVTFRLRTAGDDGETVWCSAIGFDAEVVETVAELKNGDAVAIAGPATISTWEKGGQHRVGLRITATRVLTVYAAGSKRKATMRERAT